VGNPDLIDLADQDFCQGLQVAPGRGIDRHHVFETSTLQSVAEPIEAGAVLKQAVQQDDWWLFTLLEECGLRVAPAQGPQDQGCQQAAAFLQHQPERKKDAARGKSPGDDIRIGIGTFVPGHGEAEQDGQTNQADSQLQQKADYGKGIRHGQIMACVVWGVNMTSSTF